MACKYVCDFTEKLQPPFCHKTYVKGRKIKKITYPRKGTCVCKHLFITCPAIFSKSVYTLCTTELVFRQFVQSAVLDSDMPKCPQANIALQVKRTDMASDRIQEEFWTISSC